MNVLPLGAFSKPDFVRQVGSLSFDQLVSKDFRYKTRRSVEIIYNYGVVTPYYEIKAGLTEVWTSNHFAVSERQQLYDWVIPSIPEPLLTCERHQVYDWAIPSIPEPWLTSKRHQVYDWAIPSIPEPLPTCEAFPIHDWAVPSIPEPFLSKRLPALGRLPETMDELYSNYNAVAFATMVFTSFVCYNIGKFVWGIASGRRQRAHQEEMQRQEEAHQKQMEIINEHQRQMDALVRQEILAAYFLIFGILMEEVEEDPIATQTKLRKSLCKFHPDKPGGNAQKFQQVEPIYQQLMCDLEPRVHKERVVRAVKEAKRARMEHLEALNMPHCSLLTFDDAFAQTEHEAARKEHLEALNMPRFLLLTFDDASAQTEHEAARKEHLETVNIAPLLLAYRNRSVYY